MNWRRRLIPERIKSILEEIENWNEDKAQNQILKLWFHARKNVPYYQDSPPWSFNGIPFLTRETLNREGKKLASNDRFNRRFYENRTGGSTGQPVKFIQDREYDDWNIATKLWYKMQAGQQFGDLECRIWGIDKKLSMKNRLLFKLYNRREFQGFCLTEREMERYARWITKNKPTWIEAYTDSMVRFCKYINGTLPSPRGVLVSGGTLYDRELIEKTFKCKVYNRYGSREMGAIACDCPEGNLHVSSWNTQVEIIEGKIYATSLRNFSMPLIRYDIGDIASGWGTCDCGLKTPVIKSIEGRSIEMFKTKDGRYISGIFFPMLWGVYHPKKEVKEVQAIQDGYDHITLNVVFHGISIPSFADWKEEIRKMMGDVIIDIKIVDELYRLPSGKICYTISKVA